MRPKTEQHLWHADVRHRDKNFGGKFTATTLFITVTQPDETFPDIDKALARTNRVLYRQRRRYSSPVIQGIAYQGTIDE